MPYFQIELKHFLCGVRTVNFLVNKHFLQGANRFISCYNCKFWDYRGLSSFAFLTLYFSQMQFHHVQQNTFSKLKQKRQNSLYVSISDLYSESSQISKMEVFAKILNPFITCQLFLIKAPSQLFDQVLNTSLFSAFNGLLEQVLSRLCKNWIIQPKASSKACQMVKHL